MVRRQPGDWVVVLVGINRGTVGRVYRIIGTPTKHYLPQTLEVQFGSTFRQYEDTSVRRALPHEIPEGIV